MAITVNFKTNKGIVTNRTFEQSTGVSIFGKVTGLFGVGEPGTWIRLNILNENKQSIFSQETTADIWGDYDFYFVTPNLNTKLTIDLNATYSISGSDHTSIPIAIGNKIPDSLPTPETESTIFSYLPLLILAGLGFLFYREIKK